MTMTLDKTIATIPAAEVAGRMKAGDSVDLIDVRTPVEYAEVHATGARNVPLDKLDPAQIKSGDGPVYVICQSGARAAKACAKLIEAGHGKVISVEGGTEAWA